MRNLDFQSSKLSPEEYRTRRDVCTVAELQKLVGSKEFNCHTLQKARGQQVYRFLVASALLCSALAYQLYFKPHPQASFTSEMPHNQTYEDLASRLDSSSANEWYANHRVREFEANSWYDQHRIAELKEQLEEAKKQPADDFNIFSRSHEHHDLANQHQNQPGDTFCSPRNDQSIGLDDLEGSMGEGKAEDLAVLQQYTTKEILSFLALAVPPVLLLVIQRLRKNLLVVINKLKLADSAKKVATANQLKQEGKLNERLKKAEDNVQSLKGQLQESAQKLAGEKDTAERLGQKLQAAHQLHATQEKLLNELKNKAKEAADKAVKIEQEKSQLQKSIKDLKSSQSELLKSVKSEKEKSASLKKEIETLKASALGQEHAAKEKLENLEKRFKESRQSVTQLMSEGDCLRQDLATAKAENQKLQQRPDQTLEVERLRNALALNESKKQEEEEARQNESERLTAECQESQTQVHLLLRDVEALNSQNNVLQDAHDDVQAEARELRDEKAKLEQQIKSLKSSTPSNELSLKLSSSHHSTEEENAQPTPFVQNSSHKGQQANGTKSPEESETAYQTPVNQETKSIFCPARTVLDSQDLSGYPEAALNHRGLESAIINPCFEELREGDDDPSTTRDDALDDDPKETRKFSNPLGEGDAAGQDLDISADDSQSEKDSLSSVRKLRWSDSQLPIQTTNTLQNLAPHTAPRRQLKAKSASKTKTPSNLLPQYKQEMTEESIRRQLFESRGNEAALVQATNLATTHELTEQLFQYLEARGLQQQDKLIQILRDRFEQNGKHCQQHIAGYH